MLMVGLVNGRTGQSVTKVAAMVTNIENEIVTIQYQVVMVRIVHCLVHSQKEDHVKSRNAQVAYTLDKLKNLISVPLLLS